MVQSTSIQTRTATELTDQKHSCDRQYHRQQRAQQLVQEDGQSLQKSNKCQTVSISAEQHAVHAGLICYDCIMTYLERSCIAEEKSDQGPMGRL